jgi:hypothetical protein
LSAIEATSEPTDSAGGSRTCRVTSSGVKMLKLLRNSEIDYMDLDFSRVEEE